MNNLQLIKVEKFRRVFSTRIQRRLSPSASWNKSPLSLTRPPPFLSPFIPFTYSLPSHPLFISLLFSVLFPLSFPFHFSQIQLEGLESAVSSPAGSGWSEFLVHFKWKIWHLVRIVLMTFTKNCIDFTVHPCVWQNTSPINFSLTPLRGYVPIVLEHNLSSAPGSFCFIPGRTSQTVPCNVFRVSVFVSERVSRV